MSETRRSIIVGGAAQLLAGGLAFRALAAGMPASTSAAAPSAPGHIYPPLLGNLKAPKRLVVWGSYTCPFTALLINTLNGIVTDMKDVVSVEWRHFPTHPPDPALHVAGLGFKGPHFWGFTFRVLSTVYAAKGEFAGLTPQKLEAFAKAEGGSQRTLAAAYADKAKWSSVKEDLLAGRLLGITRTPGLFYNGYFMTPDGLPLDTKAFDQSLRTMLKA